MNPQSNESNGISLPTPVPDQYSFSQQQNQPGESAPAASEQAANGAEATAVQSAAAAAMAVSAPVPGGTLPTASDVTQTTSSVVPVAIDDSDLIEKEWVNKAKAIVEKNRNDPYKQSEELTGVKTDYLQQRYNKTLKSGS